MPPNGSPIVVLALAVALLVAACATPAPPEGVPPEVETTVPPEAEPGDAATSTSPPTGETAEVPIAGATEQPTQEPGGGDGVGHATLTIGDNAWSFDQVLFCTTQAQEDETTSFVMIAQQDGVQLTARINDPTGERRLEGEGVWDLIQVVEPPQTGEEGFEVFPGWLASSQASGEQFIVLDGLAVTASAKFDDFAGEFEQIPGTLQATCP